MHEEDTPRTSGGGDTDGDTGADLARENSKLRDALRQALGLLDCPPMRASDLPLLVAPLRDLLQESEEVTNAE